MAQSLKAVDKVRPQLRVNVVLRNASAYACILKRPVQISNIRGKRPTPGLKQQHLSGLQLLKQITVGSLDGANVGAREIVLRPGDIQENEFVSEQGAGYVYYLLILIALLRSFYNQRYPSCYSPRVRLGFVFWEEAMFPMRLPWITLNTFSCRF